MKNFSSHAQIKRILIWVLISHFVVLLVFYFSGVTFYPKKQTKPLLVKEMRIVQPKPNEQPQKKVSYTKKKIKKESKPKPSPPKKSLSLPKHLLDEVEQSFAKLDEKETYQQKKETKDVKKIELTIDAKIFEKADKKTNQEDFEQQLVEELQNHLHLPEFGQVKLSMKINVKGEVYDIEILDAMSIKNKNYLKNTLPKLRFPWFNQYLQNKNDHTFTITFRNDTK